MSDDFYSLLNTYTGSAAQPVQFGKILYNSRSFGVCVASP